MASIITNRSALQALQSVNAAGRELAATQGRVATGLKVGGAKDDGATFAIAQTLRAEVLGWAAASQSLERTRSAISVSSAAASDINDHLIDLRAKATAYADGSLSPATLALLREDIETLIKQVSQKANVADFDGLNFINGGGTPGFVARLPTTTYSAPTSPLTPQSFNTVMSAGASNSSVTSSMTTTSSYSLPYSPLTPDSFASFAPAAVSSGTVVSQVGRVLDGEQTLSFTTNPYGSHPFGGLPTRVDFEFDMLVDADVVEVWQNGTRVAATGQPQATDGLAVNSGVAVSGRQMLSFDYLPAKGDDIEVRINRGLGGTPLIYYGATAGGPLGVPAPPPTSTISRSISSTPQTTPLPATPLTLETSGSPAVNGNPTAPYLVAGGTNPGRVDLLFDASITPDVVEIWQNGNRVAASGQPYVSGGAPVGAGIPTAGGQVISFDYDPADGQTLEFRFNENNAHPGAAWAVGGIGLQTIGSPFPTISAEPFTRQSVQVNVAEYAEFTSVPPLLTPEIFADTSASRTYTINGGANSGRIDVAFDAYAEADVLEVWQGGAMVASSGSVSGEAKITFDYNPNNGRDLEFRFNPGDNSPGAWTVGAISFNPIGSPPVTRTLGGGPGLVSGTIFAKINPVQSADGNTLEVARRDLTAVGLGLTNLDWSDPNALLKSLNDAIVIATEAATYLGSQEKLLEGLIVQNAKLRETLDSGIGNLVDADLGKESAKLQAAQIKAQLSAQTVSIANSEPQWLLRLFDR
ncbi:hypothetical protein BH10PSE1_BH10PSE1_18390 [soil metagenome]